MSNTIESPGGLYGVLGDCPGHQTGTEANILRYSTYKQSHLITVGRFILLDTTILRDGIKLIHMCILLYKKVNERKYLCFRYSN